MSTKTARPTVEQLTKKLSTLGLKEIDLPANATTQTKRFFDEKGNRTFISFKNGHVARTLEGTSGRRVSINETKAGELVMLSTEPARLNRIIKFLEGKEN